MASPRLAKSLRELKNRRKARLRLDRANEKRQLHLETLEDRRVMAQGPSLVAVIPNDEALLSANGTNTLTFPASFPTAPTEMTFRFAQGNSIDPTSLAGGFVVKSAGLDRLMGDADDQTITPGYIGLGDTAREVVMRFAATLPDNLYSVTLVGATLKDTTGNAFNGGVNQTINFTLDLGAKIDAIVPQPITRGAGSVLQQSSNTIDVYFDQQMSTTDAANPSFYHLIDATSSAITLPSSVKYSVDTTLTAKASGFTVLSFNGVSASSPLGIVTGSSGTSAATIQANLNTILALSGKVSVTGPNGGPYSVQFTGSLAGQNLPALVSSSANTLTVSQQPKATLTFLNPDSTPRPIPAGTWKVEIGTTAEPDDRITVAQHVGNSMTTPIQAFIGDNLLLTGAAQANDVDLYKFDIQNMVSDFAVAVTPAAGSTLNPVVRLFDSSGAPIAISSSLGQGTYYVGVSSAGNASYNPNTGAGAAGGTSTGAYSIKVSFSDLPASTDDTFIAPNNSGNVDNSSFATATVLGVVGNSGKSVNASIGPSPDLSQQYSIQLPGAGDAPGDRNVPFESHLTTIPGTLPDPNSGLTTITYDFQSVYGFTPQGQKFFNSITEPQKQRAREAMELWSRYLGVQFKEVDTSVIADMTIATGDPRAIAPTISTDVTNGQGVNGIAGNDVVVSNSDTSGLQLSNPITGASNTPTIVITSIGHGLETGALVQISGVLGNTNANGTFTVTRIDANHFSLNGPSGNGGYAGGGVWAHAITGASNPGFIGFINPAPVVITSPGHGLKTGAYVQITGVQGQTAANGAFRVTVLDQDRFSIDGSTGSGIYTLGGTWNALNISQHIAMANGLVNWGNSQYGGAYFQTIMHEIGHVLGLGDNYEAAALTIMGGGETPSQAANRATAEPVFPGDADIVYGQAVQRPESKDVDVFQFAISESGLFRAETVAERLPNGSLLNTVLTLYKQDDITKAQTVIARNDDYYGNDSYLEVHLDRLDAVTGHPLSYFVAVTSVGNTEFDPAILDSGFGGRTQGAYNLKMSVKPDAATTSMRDATGRSFDGDADGNPGGTYQFWFQANTAANTFYVDKTPPTSPSGAVGSITNPYTVLSAALTAAGQQPLNGKKIVRIVGNGGTDGSVNTFGDDKTYQIGFKDPQRLQPLADGGEIQVPKNVTVMIDAGTAFKMRRANLNAGTTPQGLVTRSGAAIQVLGTPNTPVVFTSYADDSVGGDSDGPSGGPQGGDYGGLVYRDDSDHERDFLSAAGSAANSLNLVMPVFLDYVNHAQMKYGGGKVNVDSVEDNYDPIHLSTARPTLSYNDIQNSANAGISGDPNSFDDDGVFPQPSQPSQFASGTIRFDDRRIGPEIHDNYIVNNSINGLFIRVRTLAGNPVDFVDVPTRWNDTDIVHVVSQNLEIAGTPGGSISPGSDRTATTVTDGRLRIDAGAVVKLGGSRIETQISSQFIAEGTSSHPIIFTSVKDDRFGASGTFDTNHDGSTTPPQPGDWGGLVFGPNSSGSIAQSRIFYGGGSIPIEGGFDRFNAVEIQEADVRIANSVLQFNDSGGSTTDRNGRGPNADATIFVRGAQPIIVNNIIRDNAGPVASINANAMNSTLVADYGQATGLLNAVPNISDNRGPLVRSNRFANNRINGMVIRGGTLTTETIWDDTDIAHILRDEIIVPNHQVSSGLRLQSTPTASLVVKLSGASAGFTADGTPLDINDRIGGTVQIIGQPGFPVVLTSISDDSVSAGFDPDGMPLFDTDNTHGTLLTGPEVNNATLIDDDVLTSSIGHFEARPGAGGSIGFGVPNSQSGVTAQGKSLLFTNQDFIFGFLNMVDVGSDGNAIDLSTSTITKPPTLVSPDLVVSEGTFQGANGLVKWHVESKFNNGVAKAINTITFSSVDALGAPSTTALGNLRFINYLDEDVQNPTDDLLYQAGTKAVVTPTTTTPPGPDFRLYTLDGPERVGFSQGGIYVPGTDLVNATYDGFAADRFANLITAIQGAGTTYSLVGNINTAQLPVFNDPSLGTVNGLADITTAMSWTVVPTSTTATITTFLELIPQNPVSVGSPGDWRGIKLNQLSNDRNVSEVIETEKGYIGTNADLSAVDHSRTPQTAQSIGNLAPNLKAGDDKRSLGFQIDGAIAYDNPADVDVYSFNADSGTEVWLDMDRTSYGLDSMIELVDADGNVLARATDTDPNVDNVHGQNSPDPGLNPAADAPPGGYPVQALSFNKDPANGRDTFSTNMATTRTSTSASGGIIASSLVNPAADPGATDSAPITLNSANHGLVTGDRVLVQGVNGTTSANGVFTVTPIDLNHFVLNGSTGNGVYTGGGTWTKLTAATRDPIMRVVLPNAANGQPLQNAPFFIRVRSQPTTLAGEAGNNLNPGLTSGEYQLQVRLQQKDEKPGSTIRFADIRYATNAIEVHGLPYHSPLAGETVEGDNNANDTFAGAQNLGNLLRVDQNTISVGGTLSSPTDVDWYRFDLGFDLLQYVTGYTDGLKTWSTMFDIDYADGSRPDTTLSVFDDTGRLILIGRDSNVQDDQSTTSDQTLGGSGGKHDAFIGPAQLPAFVPLPGLRRSYFVAVTSDRELPSVLDQTFAANPTDANVRLEPIESVARVADNPLEMFSISRHTTSGAGEFPDDTYVDPGSTTIPSSNQLDQTSSTLIDSSNAQALQANIRPFSLGDVQMFISTQDLLLDVDPTTALAFANARTDFQTGSIIANGTASGTVAFDDLESTQLTFTAQQPGLAGNNIRIAFNRSDRTLAGTPGVGVSVSSQTFNGVLFNFILISLDNDADDIQTGGGIPVNSHPSTASDVIAAVASDPVASSLVSVAFNSGATGTSDIANTTTPPNFQTLPLTGGIANPGALSMSFRAAFVGTVGNNIVVNFTRADLGGAQPPQISVSGTTINVTLNKTQNGPTSGTTAQQLIAAFATNVSAFSLLSLPTIIQGGAQTDIANGDPANPPPASFSLRLSGGNSGFGSIEGQYAPATVLRTANNSFVNDIAYRSDGVLFGYEGIAANNNGTAGRLTQIDTAVGNATAVGNDSIPDDPTTAPTPPLKVSDLQTDTLDNGDAMAWGGSVLPNGVTVNNTSLFYAVQDFGTGASRLYRANPTNGSAAVAAPGFGRVGVIPSGNAGANAVVLGNGALITAATSAAGSTNFADNPVVPSSPVSVSFRTVRVGQTANGGQISFTAEHLGLGVKPQVTINQAFPSPNLSVRLNLDSSDASRTRTFAAPPNSNPPSVDIQFDAGLNRLGAAGNNIVINFSLVNRNGQGPSVSFGGANNNTASVLLDTSVFQGPFGLPGSGYEPHIGTTAQQLVDAINNAATNNGILKATIPGGTESTIVSSVPIPPLQLVGGNDPSTAQDVINAINAANQPAGQPFAGQVIQATLASGNGNTVVALEDAPGSGTGKTYVPVGLNGALGTAGNTMGLAFANDRFTLYGVTDQGQFLQNISTFTAAPVNVFPVSLPDPRTPGAFLSGSSLRFAAMTLGPQDVENGRFANLFFAITEDGILTALNTQGEPQLIFDTDGDGVADSTDILTGASQLTGTSVNGFPVGNPVTGLAFSPFDFNLWHPTFQRQNDPGHDAGDPSGLNTSNNETLTFPSSGRGQDSINASFYFGFEPFVAIPGYTTSSYQPYGIVGSSLPTGNDNLLLNNGQFGMIDAPTAVAPNFFGVTSDQRQRELSLNSLNDHPTYNTPVGAYGSLITDKFSLGGMSSTDKPTFYFDYFLDTEDTNAAARAGAGLMRDSARVYVGPFTRFDATGGPFVTGSVSDPAATNKQFKAFSPVTFSGVDGFYNGKALQFTSGALIGQVHIISDYVGASHTFKFQDGFATAPGSTDSFQIAFGYVTWDLVATNNSVLDNPFSGGPGTSGVEGEIPTFLSASASANPANPRQQVQLMHDNTGQWRQARVDLSRYAGQTGLQLRFDFSTAGEMPDPLGHVAPWEQEGATPFNVRGQFPPTNVVAAPGQEYLFEDGFGRLNRIDLRQNNDHEGFYVDNIIIGPAERGEMVINAPVNSNFTDLYAPGSITQPRNFNPQTPVPTQTLAGPYQLEMRRGTEYGISDGGPLSSVNFAHNTQTPIIVLNTNDRLISDQRDGTPIPVESFETQNFNALPWGFNDDAPWTISGNASAGNFSAESGKITNGQSSGLSIDLITGGGFLTFSRSTDSEASDPATGKRGDVLRLFIDGRLATFTAVDGEALATPRFAEWSGNNPFQVITVPIAAGEHNFRWTYEKDNTDTAGSGQPLPIGQDKVFIDDIHFPTPQVGVESIYEDSSLHDPADPTAVNPPILPTIPPPNSFALIHFIDTLYAGMTRGGDQNLDRQQGHIQIEQNLIYAAQQIGILIDAAARDPVTGNPLGVRNLPVLNNDRLVPGVTIVNNVVASSGSVGIQYNGDANGPNAQGQSVGRAAVPFGRIVNNTVYGGATPSGTGILIINNAAPTLLNNIVANTATGISVDASSSAIATDGQPLTILGENLYANNALNTNVGGSAGSNPIFLTPTDPLFIDAAHNNFYLAANSPAIDSSLDTLQDRPSIAAVESSIGVSLSPILAPDRDLYGQLRLDDPTVSPPPGFGANVFKDRGAVEKADFDPPIAAAFVTDSDGIDIVDNDTAHRDRNTAPIDLAIRNTSLIQFVVQLSDSGVGIDDFTVDPLGDGSQFTLTSDGALLYNQFTAVTAGRSPDYFFIYNAATDQAIFKPSAGIWPQNHTYQITLNNNDVGATDPQGNPLPAGIFDKAGNPLTANRANGQVTFNIFVGILYDFGDAPDPTYPTLLASNGAAHIKVDNFQLGATNTEEPDAFQSANADGDKNPDGTSSDDGVVFVTNPSPNISNSVIVTNTIKVTASIPSGLHGFLNAWLDSNHDGVWSASEKLNLVNSATGTNELLNGSNNTLTYNFGNAATPHGSSFMRFRFSSDAIAIANPTGVALDGEVEDYKVLIAGPPYQNASPTFALARFDVNNSGFLSSADALTIINYLNAGYRGIPLVLGQPPIPDPAGGGPGKALYVDVDGDTFLKTADALEVIAQLNFIRQHPTPSPEGESAGSTASAMAATSDAPLTNAADNAPEQEVAMADMAIPPVLYASPSVVVEVRDRSAAPLLVTNSSSAAEGEGSHDAAMLDWVTANSQSSEGTWNAPLKSKVTDLPLDASSWEDLLAGLASDQPKKK